VSGVTLPIFPPHDDPGPDFAGLVRRLGLEPPTPDGPVGATLDITHATTCVAVRYADGALIAGDRRATSGNFISHRAIEKVFPADRHSGIAIAGAAGPAMEMVKLFQLQLEHYEKVEGGALSLEGKANQLGQMVRNHLPAAMQGMAVVPIFAGYDLRRGAGRLFQYDVTGGRYEESNFAATGSGSLHASTVVKLGFREGLSRDDVVDLALRALFEAADEDSATGGPDLMRRIFPVIATITRDGFTRIEDDEIAERFRVLLDALEVQAAAIPRVPETVTEVAGGAGGTGGPGSDRTGDRAGGDRS
jgi:proteasome beta subunit